MEKEDLKKIAGKRELVMSGTKWDLISEKQIFNTAIYRQSPPFTFAQTQNSEMTFSYI